MGGGSRPPQGTKYEGEGDPRIWRGVSHAAAAHDAVLRHYTPKRRRKAPLCGTVRRLFCVPGLSPLFATPPRPILPFTPPPGPCMGFFPFLLRGESLHNLLPPFRCEMGNKYNAGQLPPINGLRPIGAQRGQRLPPLWKGRWHGAAVTEGWFLRPPFSARGAFSMRPFPQKNSVDKKLNNWGHNIPDKTGCFPLDNRAAI